MTPIASCPVCGNTSLNPFLSCVDYTVSQETFSLVKCLQCSLIITQPQPATPDLSRYYRSENYTSHSIKSTSIIDAIYTLARSFTLRWKLKIISESTEIKAGKILDYGCGTGEFLHACQTNGWKTFGVEPSDLARSKAVKTSRSCIAPSIKELMESDFDSITLWHVLEHIPNLDETLQQIRSKLTSNGTLFIAVPNPQCFDALYYKNLWAGYDVPRHLWHFSQQNIRLLMAKNGFSVNAVIPMQLDAFYVSMLSEKYKNNRQTLVGILKAFVIGIRSNLKGSKTGEYSSLIYILKK